MPAMKAGESQKEWLSRCIPHLIDKEGKTKEAAAGQCYGMWRNKHEDILTKLGKIIDSVTTGGATTTSDIAKVYARGRVDIVSRPCPEGYVWSKGKKVCIRKTNEANYIFIEKGGKQKKVPDDPKVIRKYTKDGWVVLESISEDARNPKRDDRFIDNKGKKATVTYVGSGISHDKYISIKYDHEKIERDIHMINFFKKFKYIRESVLVGGTYGNSNTNIAGSQQTRVVGDRDNEIEVIKRQPRPLRFNRLVGAYLPSE